MSDDVSDAVALPAAVMRQAMFDVPAGNGGDGEDAPMTVLAQQAVELTGKRRRPSSRAVR